MTESDVHPRGEQMTTTAGAPLNPELAWSKWVELAPLLDRMVERTGTAGEFPIVNGSSLSVDDDESNPYQVSHVVRMCLSAGVDHLHAMKVLIVDQQVVHVAAPASLARGALENFAAAYWVLGPATRSDRVERALRWHAQNMKDQHKAIGPLNLAGHIPSEDKLKKLDAIAVAQQLLPKAVRAGYSSTEAVKYAEANAADLVLGVVLPWQICSGFAHGRPWAYLGVSAQQQTPAVTGNVVNVRLTSDLTRALYPALAAMRLLEELLHLFERAAGTSLD